MLPLVKKGQTVEYWIGKHKNTAQVFQSNPKAVWIIDGSGRVIKLHKKVHRIKVIEEPKKGKEEETSKESLDDLYKLKGD